MYIRGGDETMKQIPLSNGGVDDDDYEFLIRWKWKRMPNGYVARSTQKNRVWVTILMHRVVNETADGFETDHINRDKLDNRKENLRNVTHAQNERNKSLRSDNKSGHVGVSWDTNRQKWIVTTKHDGKARHLGRFNDIDEAIAAYEAYVVKNQLRA
jgi:hypothetical protein